MRFRAWSTHKCKLLASGDHFIERTGPPAPLSAGHYTSEMNIEVRLHWGDKVMLGGNSVSKKRNNEIYRLPQFEMIDCIRKLYVFAKKMHFSLSATCLHLHGLRL